MKQYPKLQIIASLILPLGIIFLLFFFAFRGNSSDAQVSNIKETSDNFRFVTETYSISFDNPFFIEWIEPTDVPTALELNMYDEILKELSDFSRTEKEIMEEIAPKYNKNVDELKKFMDRVMPFATGFKKIEKNPNIPKKEKIIECVEISLNEVIESEFSLSSKDEDWYIGNAAYSYTVTTSIRDNDYNDYGLLITIEFDESYETFTISQIKLDGKSIDLYAATGMDIPDEKIKNDSVYYIYEEQDNEKSNSYGSSDTVTETTTLDIEVYTTGKRKLGEYHYDIFCSKKSGSYGVHMLSQIDSGHKPCDQCATEEVYYQILEALSSDKQVFIGDNFRISKSFHKENCEYLKTRQKKVLTVQQAIDRKLRPCDKCKPID